MNSRRFVAFHAVCFRVRLGTAALGRTHNPLVLDSSPSGSTDLRRFETSHSSLTCQRKLTFVDTLGKCLAHVVIPMVGNSDLPHLPPLAHANPAIKPVGGIKKGVGQEIPVAVPGESIVLASGG